jgi:hypothetical protein
MILMFVASLGFIKMNDLQHRLEKTNISKKSSAIKKGQSSTMPKISNSFYSAPNYLLVQASTLSSQL